jgi:hypothetical protein
MNNQEDEDLFETDDDQDMTDIEEDVIKSIRKKPGRDRVDRLENELKSKKDRLRRRARREKHRRFPEEGL